MVFKTMGKPKKLHKGKKRRRTSLEIEEEQSRTLYIRLPHTIKDVKEIKDLFFGDFKVKLPRQTGRYCHVIFPNVEEKIKNLKALKKKLVDGKQIYAGPPRPINLEKKKKRMQKKIVMPEPKDEPSIGKYLFISNIPPGVKASEVKDAFPGSVTVGLLKGLRNGSRQARVKMSSVQICYHYANNQAEWPVIHGKKVTVSISKASSNNNKKKRKQKSSQPLKIYDGEKEITDTTETDKKSVNTTKAEESDNNESESDDEENEENEENEETDEDEDEDEYDEVEGQDEE